MDKTNIIKLPPQIQRAFDIFFSGGYEAYIVGGCIRDSLMSKKPHDWDMATDALPTQVRDIFYSYKTIDTGLKHGTVTVIIDGVNIEITTFRTESGYSDARRPDSVEFSRSIEEDLSRRDFTVNAMAYSPRAGIIDLFSGKGDLERGLIRCVGDESQRFSEDALRIMRAFRFSAQLGFEIEGNTLNAAALCRERLKKIAPERISGELVRLLSAPAPSGALAQMTNCGVLKVIAPDFAANDVDKGYFAAVDRAAPEVSTRAALLLRCLPPDKAVGTLEALRFDKQTVRTAERLLDENRRMPPDTPPALRRLLSRCGERTGRAAVDFLIASGKLREAADTELERILSACECYNIKCLAISGSDLEAIGVPLTRDMGCMLEYLLECVLDTPSLNDRAILLDMAQKKMKGITADF